MDILEKINNVLNEDVLSAREVVELLKDGKVIYGVKQSTDDESGIEIFHVSKIDDLEEYEKNNYWSIEGTYDSEIEAERHAKTLAKSDPNGIYVGIEYEGLEEDEDLEDITDKVKWEAGIKFKGGKVTKDPKTGRATALDAKGNFIGTWSDKERKGTVAV